jgi:5-methylcytosine-specific restriction endonuclease McrA
MTKTISRKMAVDCLLWLVQQASSLKSVFNEESGKGYFAFQCYICKEPLYPWQTIQFDHVHADVHGGGHEYENLRPVHYDPCHKKKSASDVAANAKVKRIQAGGRKSRGPKMRSRGFQQVARPFPKRRKSNAPT